MRSLGQTGQRYVQLGGYRKPEPKNQETLDRAAAKERRELAEAMLARRMQQQPQIDNVFSGAALLVNTYSDRYRAKEAQEQERKAQEAYRSELAKAAQSPDIWGALSSSTSPELAELGLEGRLKAQIAAQTPQDMKWVEFSQGDRTVAGWADPRTGKIMQVADAPRYKPSSGGGPSVSYQRTGNIVDANNNPLGAGVFNPRDGMMYYQSADGQMVKAPPGSREVPEAAGGPINLKQFQELELEYLQETQALNRLNSFFQTVGGTDQGINRWANDVSANIKTLLGDELNVAELNQQVARGELQGLLGLFRTDIVGPGVMTEYDAQRVVMALGGDITALQNPQVVQELLGKLYGSKIQRAQLLEQQLSRSAPYFGVMPPQPEYAPMLGGQKPTPSRPMGQQYDLSKVTEEEWQRSARVHGITVEEAKRRARRALGQNP